MSILTFSKSLALIMYFFFLVACTSQTPGKEIESDSKIDKVAIQNALMNQQNDWNQGDIPAFMEGYIKSEALSFIGSKGITRGWQNTLDNYLKSYPDSTAMGQLEFEILELKKLSSEYYYMIGKYTLHRVSDQPSGYFNLVWQKVENNWLIISDHTSSS